MVAQVRRVHEDIKRFSAFGRNTRFGMARRCEIAGRVRCRFAAAIDRIELLFRIAREHKAVVLEVVIGLVQTKIEHNAGASGFEL